jgi:hypothetical protein
MHAGGDGHRVATVSGRLALRRPAHEERVGESDRGHDAEPHEERDVTPSISPKRSPTECTLSFCAVAIATSIVMMSGTLATRVKSPIRISVPHTSFRRPGERRLQLRMRDAGFAGS